MDLFFSTVFITLDPQEDLRKYGSRENTVKHSLGNRLGDELDLRTYQQPQPQPAYKYVNTMQHVSPRSGRVTINIIDYLKMNESLIFNWTDYFLKCALILLCAGLGKPQGIFNWGKKKNQLIKHNMNCKYHVKHQMSASRRVWFRSR